VGALGCVLGGASVIAVVLVVLIVVASIPDPLALALSFIAASIPALVYAGIVLRLDRYEVEPVRTIAACFAWGAIGAVLLSLIGGLIFEAALQESLGAEGAAVLSTVVGAPLIEESFKGIAVLVVLIFARSEFDDVLDGLVYGALIGVGFAMTENILYFGQAYQEGGLGSFGVLVLARSVLSGLGHPSYTAVTGAAVGWSRERYGHGFARIVVPILGWLGAVALHMAWNGGLVLTTVVFGDDLGLIGAVFIQALIVIIPAAVVLYTIARISARNELEILRQQLRAEVARGTLTDREYQMIVDPDRRQQALAAAREAGGFRLRSRQQAFFHTAAELAFRSYHQQRGEQARSDRAARDEADRRRLSELRGELVAAGIS
jgi:RsiW-degrading membrane proteinase PrsW (M82 family)